MDLNNNTYRKSNFSTAFFFLEKKRRKALSIYYNFARYVDDIADSNIPKEIKIKKLLEIKNEFEKNYLGESKKIEINEVYEIINYYQIPSKCFLELIDGMLFDCGDVDIKTEKELENYMYKVAGVVGIAVLKICGYNDKNIEEIATYTGYAVQLTNIIRDFYQDYEIKRIYIPQTHRVKILGSEKIDINNHLKIKELLEYERNINRNYYKISSEIIKKNRSNILFVTSIMKNIYYEILENLNFESIKKNHKIYNWKKIKSFINSVKEIYF